MSPSNRRAVHLHKREKLERKTFSNALPRRGDIFLQVMYEVLPSLKSVRIFGGPKVSHTKKDGSPTGEVCWGWV